MTRLAIKSLSSPDVEIDAWQPDPDQGVYVLLQVEIAEAGDNRADVFSIMVATLEGLRQHGRGEVISDRATLILSRFSWPAVRQWLDATLARCGGRDWNESVLRLQRYFRWEYEDFAQAES
jgi:hypothetical protein